MKRKRKKRGAELIPLLDIANSDDGKMLAPIFSESAQTACSILSLPALAKIERNESQSTCKSAYHRPLGEEQGGGLNLRHARNNSISNLLFLFYNPMKNIIFICIETGVLSLLVACILLMNAALFAQTTTPATPAVDVPHAISYQGLLTQNGITIPDGQYNLTVTFYGDAQGSSQLWQGTYSAQVMNGVFNLSLGSGDSPFPNTAIFNQQLWVGVKIEGGEEMRPLTQLSSSPSALAIPNGSVTAE